jgi:hypothetical protein
MGRTLVRRSGIPGAWLRCSIIESDAGAAEGDNEASLGVGEEEVEAEAACLSLSAGMFELETLAMALIGGLDLDVEVKMYGTTSHDDNKCYYIDWYGRTQKRWATRQTVSFPSLHEISPLLVSTILS